MHWHWYKSLLSLLPVLWGVQMVRELRLTRRLRRVGVEVAGRVVRRRRIRGVDRSYYVPTFRFTTPGGQRVRAESFSRASGFGFRTGTTVRLCYDPDHPTRLLLVSELGNGSRYARLGIAGLLLAALWGWG